MHINSILRTILLLTLTVGAVACDDDLSLDETDTRSDDITRPNSSDEPKMGETWGPCDFGRYDDPNWWGCNGSPGYGLACLMPVSDDGLNICVPQTNDPKYDDDCGNLTAPFGLGVRLQGSAYCVPDCMTDDDCGPGRACSPASHFCAWIGE